MTRLARTVLLSLAALAAVAAAGCGNKHETVIVGETEGIYVSVDELTYQVQLSRILDPASVEDRAYLAGLPEGEETSAEEVWFAIFMRVENETNEELSATDTFSIVDTQDTRFEPIELDSERNEFDYEAREIPAGELLPEFNSPPSDNTIQGALLLFKVDIQSLYNRPLELEIESLRGEGVQVRHAERESQQTQTRQRSRTPTLDENLGRHHWPQICPLVFAGGGLRHGQIVGASDRIGHLIPRKARRRGGANGVLLFRRDGGNGE